mmetsp:Transcript_53904/g.125776  ORF Transcript_53904/g.125776 Transcript_53904/m.125776 type:complete len:80 (+) Transcript_53904:255-494(+)
MVTHGDPLTTPCDANITPEPAMVLTADCSARPENRRQVAAGVTCPMQGPEQASAPQLLEPDWVPGTQLQRLRAQVCQDR